MSCTHICCGMELYLLLIEKKILLSNHLREIYKGTFKENENLFPSRFKILNSSVIALGVSPGLLSDP